MNMIIVRSTEICSAFDSLGMRQQAMRSCFSTLKTKLVPPLQCAQEITGKAVVSVCKDEREGVNIWVLEHSRGLGNRALGSREREKIISKAGKSIMLAFNGFLNYASYLSHCSLALSQMCVPLFSGRGTQGQADNSRKQTTPRGLWDRTTSPLQAAMGKQSQSRQKLASQCCKDMHILWDTVAPLSPGRALCVKCLQAQDHSREEHAGSEARGQKRRKMLPPPWYLRVSRTEVAKVHFPHSRCY